MAAGHFDVFSGTVSKPAYVLVDGTTIVSAGRDRPACPAETAELDLMGSYLVPGLIDCHSHLCFDSAADDCVTRLSQQPDDELAERMRQRAASAAARGVTTVRDVGDRGFLVTDLVRSADPALPTIVSAGPPLTSPGGHCHYLGGAVASTRDAVAAVARNCERGVDLIKIMVTGGILTRTSDPGELQFSPETVRSVVREAHRRGRPVAAHAHSCDGIRLAFNSGVDTIEHATFASETAFGMDDQFVGELSRSRRTICPTFVERQGVRWDPPHLAWRKHVLMTLHRRGVAIAAGTDAGVKKELHHDSLPWAVAAMAKAGIPPADALISATLGAAMACNLGNSKGRLAAAADADIVAITADPLDDLTALITPSFVMIRGTVVRSDGSMACRATKSSLRPTGGSTRPCIGQRQGSMERALPSSRSQVPTRSHGLSGT